MKSLVRTVLRLTVLVTLVAAMVGTVASTAGAGPGKGNQLKLMAQAAIYDPDLSGQVQTAAWLSGYGEGAGQGLVLAMYSTVTDYVTYPDGASADATIVGAAGLRLRGLAFDRLKTSHCTGGSPRWDVELANGGIYGIGCSSGTHAAVSSPGWESVTFSDADVQHLSGPAWPSCFSSDTSACTLSFLQVLQDEGPESGTGSAQLDNLKVTVGSGTPSVFVFGKGGATVAS